MTSEMKHDFVKEIMDKTENQAKPQEEDSGSSIGFKAGFVIGSALVIAGSICLEVWFLMAALSILGITLTLLKRFAIVLAV